MSNAATSARYRNEHREELRERRLAAYKENPDRFLRWHRENPEYIKAYRKDWARKNNERIREKERKRYWENHERSLAIAKLKNKKYNTTEAARARKKFYVEKLGGKCLDCGTAGPPCIFHFDHRDPRSKLYNVGVILGRKKISVIEAEIAKCDLVCANCHAIRTWVKGE